MAVYLVTLLAPNGNRVSRPIVAADADYAKGIMAVEHDMCDGVLPSGFEVRATLMADPDHEIEASLSRMNTRNDLAERRGR